MDRSVLVKVLGFAAALAAGPRPGWAQVCTQHTFIGGNPDEGDPGWHVEAQGIAHDADNWYITQNPAFVRAGGPAGPIVGGGPRLWKVPVTHDLGEGIDCDDPGAACTRLFDTELFELGFNHFGDLDFFEFGGHGYVVVPVDVFPGDPHPAMAFFRADETLEFLAVVDVPGQNASGWVVVDADGLLVSSNSPCATQFNRFSLNWSTLEDATPQPVLTPQAPILPRDPAGLPLEFEHPQGGDYSADGQLLYFVNGFLNQSQGSDCPNAGFSWGVHVFRTRPGSPSECDGLGSCLIARRIERSHNGPGGFAYEFDPNCGLTDPEGCEEPEGLAFWDLDADGRAPGPGGQLHVMLLDNDLVEDDVHVKHYRSAPVDAAAPEINCPADAVAECSAHGGAPAGDPQLALFFAGVSAIDVCDEQPAVASDAPAFFGLGTTDVSFTATDDAGNAASCLAQVTVRDTRSPVIVCPPPATVECTSPAGISAGDPQLASFFGGVTASDTCDATPSVSNDAPATLPLGATTVTFTAADDSTNASSCGSTVTVADTTPPQLSVALEPDTLWPPNHRLVRVTAAVTVSDRCDPAVTFELLSVTSNEPDDGLGDGDMPADIQGAQPGTPDTMFALRAERSGTGAGRTYTIVYRARDRAGNESTATALVRVPH
jgi:hypothetical protein